MRIGYAFAPGWLVPYYQRAATPFTVNIYGNIIVNCTFPNTGALYGIYSSGSATNANIYSNEVGNLTKTVVGLNQLDVRTGNVQYDVLGRVTAKDNLKFIRYRSAPHADERVRSDQVGRQRDVHPGHSRVDQRRATGGG